MRALVAVHPRDGFTGRISEFVDAYVVPNLPPVDVVLAWTEALLGYHDTPGATFVVRAPVGRRGAPYDVGGQRCVEGDNSPGRWCYLRALDGAVAPGEVGAVIHAGALAVLWAAKRAERSGWTYGRMLSAKDKAIFSLPRLKHCHIESALDGAPPAPRVRALRNLCPINHFLFPMPSKFAMSRVGWTESPAKADLGESDRVIAWVQQRVMERVGPEGRSLYLRYLSAVEGRVRALPADGEIRITPK